MTSYTTDKFWRLYALLPLEIRKQAKTAYLQFRDDPYYPGLQFKQVHPSKPIYLVRIGIDYRAVGILDGGQVTWFWIGSHAQYDKLLRNA